MSFIFSINGFRIWSSTPAINDLEGLELGAWWKTSGNRYIGEAPSRIDHERLCAVASAWTSAFAVVLERKRSGEGRVLQGLQGKLGVVYCIQGSACWLGLEAGTWDDKMTQVVIKSFLTWLFVRFLCWLTFIFFNSQSVFLLREGGSMVSKTSARLPPESLPL